MRVICLLFIMMFFTSCSYKTSSISNFVKSDFSKIFVSSASEICKNLSSEDLEKDFYILDFVNINDLNNHSQLGLVLSNQLKTDLLKECKGMVLKEIEIGKKIKLGESGSKILTRELEEIRAKVVDENSNLVIGSYALTSENLLLFIKVVDLVNGTIKTSTTVSTALTKEIVGLENNHIRPTKTSSKREMYQNDDFSTNDDTNSYTNTNPKINTKTIYKPLVL